MHAACLGDPEVQRAARLGFPETLLELAATPAGRALIRNATDTVNEPLPPPPPPPSPSLPLMPPIAAAAAAAAAATGALKPLRAPLSPW